MRRTEEQFNTHEQAKGYLAASLRIIETGNVPDDLRVAAFTQVYQSVSGKQVFFEQPAAIPRAVLGLGNGS